MNTDTADLDVWRQLARLIYARRQAMNLTQEEFAKHLGVGLGTITRLEGGVKITRRAPSWPRVERGLGWPEGFIEDFVTGKVQGLPVPEPDDARFTRQPKNDATEIVRDLVRRITLEVAPGTSIARVLELEEQFLEFARTRGFVGPPESPPTADDV